MSLTTLVSGLDPLSTPPAAVPNPAPTGGRPTRPAAVLALFAGAAEDPDLLFTERAATLRSQPGQVSFPGGVLDDSDRDPAAGALRETREEIGLEPDAVTLLGALPGVRPTITQHTVTVVVGTWDGVQPLRPEPSEVALVHRYRMSELADPQHRVTARHPRGGRGVAFWIDDVVIWGFTAWLADDLLSLGGWQQPWDRTRVVDVPERFSRRAPSGVPAPG